MSDGSFDVRKPLPAPGKDDELPPPPPSYSWDSSSSPQPLPPLPPPKPADEEEQEISQVVVVPSDNLLAPGGFDAGLAVPSVPTTPTSPTNTMVPEGKPKKNNPLVDLIETEKVYVEQLTGVVRKIASAWSRSNLPPPELDSIFRSIEAVCKANRSLLSKLKEIGTNPASPKALGDLLMRWVGDLEGPYTAYCYHYCTGFDDWGPILSNERLQPILVAFSEYNSPPASLLADANKPIWTLDMLFLLPKIRLKYYKKLYNRLLKSTAPGRSDYRLLVSALEKLDNLLSTLEERANLKAGTTLLPPLPSESVDEVVIDMRTQPSTKEGEQSEMSRTSVIDAVTESADSSVRGSSISSSERFSRDTASTSTSTASRNTMTTSLVDLERRLATERTLDIFTMTPKVVRLQMAPPTLKYTRELRFSIDVVVRFTPKSTGVEIIHRHGHVFLLSDLFLVCEKMSPEDRSQHEPGGADMWLCYPPLAGKVLRVSEVIGKENALEVSILRKESLILETESMHIRDFMLAEFRECIGFATTVVSSASQPMPPTHPSQFVDGHSLPAGQPPSNRPPRGLPPNPRVSRDLPPIQGLPQTGLLVPQRGVGAPPITFRDGRVTDVQTNPQRAPSQQDSLPVSLYPRSVSAQPVSQVPQNNAQAFFQQNQNHNFGPPNEDISVRAGPSRGPPVPFGHPMSNLSNSQPFAPNPQALLLPPYPGTQERSASEPVLPVGLRNSPSTPSLLVPHHNQTGQGPTPPFSNGYQPFNPNAPNNIRNDPYGSIRAPQPRPMLPSALNVRVVSMAVPSSEPSPPHSPVEETVPTGPVTSTISAQMKCKVFLQQQHAQWKSLGPAKLKLYNQQPTNVKQLVVEADNKGKSILISTIVLTDGVERVGKTGVAVELSDKGTRTGIIYMIQLRNETSAGGLFNSLLEGSDRAGRG